MPIVTFMPGNLSVEVPPYSNLHDAAVRAGLTVEIPCGGRGLCGKCIVAIESGEVDFDDTGLLPESDQHLVLICMTKVKDAPVTVRILRDLASEKGKFSSATDDLRLLDKQLLPTTQEYDPIVKPLVVTVQKPMPADGLSDLNRLKNAITTQTKHSNITVPINALRKLPEAVRAQDGKVTVFYDTADNAFRVADVLQGEGYKNYGIAVDIGTTTVAVQIVDLSSGEILAAKTDYNGQINRGVDVIARINYARKPERLIELQDAVVSTINRLIGETCALAGIAKETLYNVSIAGNTTMIHLLLGIHPEFIRLAPYTPCVYHIPLYSAEAVLLDTHPKARVYFAPSVGSYVGGDITSGILCTSLATDSEELCLFLDIGTNGEMILGNNDFLIGCACSAGPAFEGGGITCGMRASEGAIERVTVDAATGDCTFGVIGNAPPKGICGSGIISLIAELLRKKWIDAAGKLNRAVPCASIDATGKIARYTLDKAAQFGNDADIYITETDIDNLIRAKAAIFSACRVMLKDADIDFSDLSRFYIAGGFGRYLDIENAITIGLIPDLPKEKFVFLGNSSVVGSYMTLISKNRVETQQRLAQNITYLDLSDVPGYMDQYTAALFLPHTDSKLFPGR